MYNIILNSIININILSNIFTFLIHRIPTIKQDHFYKFAQKNVENQFHYTYQDITYKDAKTKQTAVNESGKYNFHNMENNIKKESTVFDQENVFVSNPKKYNDTAVPSMTKVITLLHLKLSI